MSGKLTTHVLDTARGCPAVGIDIRLSIIMPECRPLLCAVTNTDGRCEKPLLEGAFFQPGTYELVFCVGAYFSRHFSDLPHPPFLGEIVLRFGVADNRHHFHIPLLVSPYGYSTYRGS